MKVTEALLRFHIPEDTALIHISAGNMSYDGPVKRELLAECIHGAQKLAQFENVRPGEPKGRQGSLYKLSADAEGALRAIGIID